MSCLLARKHTFLKLLVILCAASISIALAQAPPSGGEAEKKKYDPELQRAVELYQGGKMVEAMPIFEKLAADRPNDSSVWEGWGTTMLSYSQTLADPELKKKARLRARGILLKAKELGDNSNLLQVLLGMIPEDGSSATFSAKQEVDEIMQKAEGDFARGDYDKAREGYAQALLLDPNLYWAAVFSGDVFFKQGKPGFAGEWFARAIGIDPNRETAYRYWGDSLKQEGKMEEARAKFIDAVIAEPYNKGPWVGLQQWADANQVKLAFLQLPQRGSVEAKDGKINITLDSSVPADDPASGGWLAYNMERALWQGDKFKKEFPNEPAYRHTVREEASALHLLVSVIAEVGESKKKKKKDAAVDPALVTLAKIDQEGLMEPFVLINRADEGIAKDYDAYRTANREKLRQYLDEFVVPKAPAKAEQN